MSYSTIIRAVTLTVFVSFLTFATPALIPPESGTVGSQLEVFTTIKLSEPAPEQGLQISITSDDERLLFSTTADQRGSKTLTLKVRADKLESPEFYIQALGAPGPATYTVSAPGCTPAKGNITIAPSAITIGGPSDSSTFRTSSGTPRKITARTALLDSEGKVVGTQPLAGGLTVNLDISSSDRKVGSAVPASVVLTGGMASQATQFKPSSPGTTVLSATVPPGFRTAPGRSGITITVQLPGIGLLTDINVGKDLQVLGYVLLGEDAPANGVDVTLTSEDPERLLLSAREDQLGSKCITVHIPAGEGKAPYWVQALAGSGTVDYTGSAPGYRRRDATITLNPSGVMVVFTPYGPPDEKEVLHPMPNPNPRPFFASLAEHRQLWLSVWPVYLDPATHRGADITAQRVRPGISVPIELKNSNPSVATVPSSLMLTSKVFAARTEFQPHSIGETTISINTPPGFTTPSNATSVTAVVRP